VTGWRWRAKARLEHLLLISPRKTSIISRRSFIPLDEYRASSDIATYRGPSMSVGDVVEIDGCAYAVDTPGFARIEDLRREQIVPGARGPASTS